MKRVVVIAVMVVLSLLSGGDSFSEQNKSVSQGKTVFERLFEASVMWQQQTDGGFDESTLLDLMEVEKKDLPTSTPTFSTGEDPTVTPTQTEEPVLTATSTVTETEEPTLTATTEPTDTPTPTVTVSITVTPTATATEGEVPPPGAVSQFYTDIHSHSLIAGKEAYIKVHALDENGLFVNPGVPGGPDEPLPLTVHVDGVASFIYSEIDTLTGTLDTVYGFSTGLLLEEPGEFDLSVSSPGISPVTQTYSVQQGGWIDGTVLVWSENEEDYVPAEPYSVNIIAMKGLCGDGGSHYAYMEDEGYFLSEAMMPGTYNLHIEGDAYADIPLSSLCLEDITVVAGQTTTVTATIPLRTGATVSGTVSTIDNVDFGFVMAELMTGGCDSVEYGVCGGIWTHESLPATGSMAVYSFDEVPPGDYDFSVYADGANGSYYYLPEPATISVPDTGPVEKDFILVPSTAIQAVTPVEFARVTNPVTFEWEVPNATSSMHFTVTIYDTLSPTPAAVFTGIEGNSLVVDFNSPEVNASPIGWYHWDIQGWSDDGTFVGMMDWVETDFIVDQVR